MLWVTIIAAAMASTSSGLGLTPMGGGLAGVTEPGVMGLPLNPAAARSEQIEGAVDFGLNMHAMSVGLQGQSTVVSDGISPMPYLGFTIPFGDFGVGAHLTVPYGGGAKLAENGPQRFHVIETESYVMEAGLAVAYQPVEWLRAGVSYRLGRGTLSKRAAMNTASIINSKADLNPPLDVNNALFEGGQDLSVSGLGMAYGLGLSVFLPGEHEVHLAYRSPMTVSMDGDVTLRPSNMMSLSGDGKAHTELRYGREFELGWVVPVGRTRLLLLGGWVDWSPMAMIDVDIDQMVVKGEDETTESLIQGTGLNASDLLDGTITINNNLGHRSTFHGGAAVDIPIGTQWTVRPGAYYSPTTLPSAGFHASIMDFTSFDLRLAGSYTPKRWLTLGLSIDQFIVLDRVIRDSSLSLDNPASSGRVLPSGNGLYQMNATRLGLTVIARH